MQMKEENVLSSQATNCLPCWTWPRSFFFPRWLVKAFCFHLGLRIASHMFHLAPAWARKSRELMYTGGKPTEAHEVCGEEETAQKLRKKGSGKGESLSSGGKRRWDASIATEDRGSRLNEAKFTQRPNNGMQRCAYMSHPYNQEDANKSVSTEWYFLHCKERNAVRLL